MTDSLRERLERASALETALREARDAIASLPVDVLGFASMELGDTQSPAKHEWSIRDELLTRIDAALAIEAEQDE